jgi:beta-N-acetylhexosaminidase
MSLRGSIVLVLLALAAYSALLPAAETTSRSDARGPVEDWLTRMTPRDKVAQLVVIHSYGEALSSRSKAYKQFVHLVRDVRVGGLIVVNRVVGGSVQSAEPHAMATFLNRMQRLARVPLIVGGDFERGASMRVSGTTKFPHLMAYGAAHDPELTRQLGKATAQEARALGVHWVFAPDADVNNNPDNPIINVRSFGEDSKQVAEQVKAFIEGAHSDPAVRVLVTVKHFPGHGDTNVDSHIGLPSLGANRARMDAMELVPFRAAIEAGVDSVMTAHMAVPAYEPDSVPATVSKHIVTDLLRKDMGFRGITVTDAMDMQGLTKQFPPGEAAVRALEAGADVLLMPPNPEAAINSIVAAVQEGRLSEKRIDESVRRVLNAKVRLGLHRNKIVDLEKISDVIESDEFAQQAQTVADRAVTVVKNDGNVLPLKSPDTACLYILAQSRYGQSGRTLLDEARSRAKSMKTILLDPTMSKTEIEGALERGAECSVNVVAAFTSVAAYSGKVGLAGNYSTVMSTLLERANPVVLIAAGNPYLLRNFPNVSAYLTTFSTAPPSEIAALKAILGEISITGRMPVSIPGHAQIGDGIEIHASATPSLQ